MAYVYGGYGSSNMSQTGEVIDLSGTYTNISCPHGVTNIPFDTGVSLNGIINNTLYDCGGKNAANNHQGTKYCLFI